MVLPKSKSQPDFTFNPNLTKFDFSLLYTFWSNCMHTEKKVLKILRIILILKNIE